MKTNSVFKLTAGLILSVLLSSFLPGSLNAQTWYNAGWLYRKAITIDFTKVGAGPHTNFPVLISRADADLQTKAQADGDDILFTAADGTTKLDHEIESYTSASGTLVAWVEIPSLSSTANTVIYMYYGHASTTNQQNTTGTWNANFAGVYHLNNAFGDATSNARNGTNTGTTNVAGKISQGRGFVRSNGADYITIAGLMGSPANATLSAWGTLTTRDATGAHIVSIGDYLTINVDDITDGYIGAFFHGAGWGLTKSAPKLNPAGSGWHYFVYTFNDAGNLQTLYMDGVQVGTSSYNLTVSYTTQGANTFIGKHANGSNNFDFDGTIDEVRIANTVRSTGWILTEYNNQNSPATFCTVGTEGTYAKVFTGTGNFSNPARWSGGTVPIAGENMIIDGTCTVDNNAGTDNIAYGTLTIGAGYVRSLSWAASGTNRLNVSNVSAGLTPSTLDMTNGGTLIIRGTWTSTNLTFTSGAGTIETRSTITLPAAYATYNSLTVNGAGTTVRLGVASALTGDLRISSGTFHANNFNFSVAGNWINNGTFTSGSGTATFNGNTVMSGSVTSHTFNNFTVAASSTLTSSTGITGLVVNGTLTTGASATLDLGTTTVLSGTLGTITNAGTIRTGVLTATSATPIPSARTWGGTIQYASVTGAQTIVGGTFNNLQIDATWCCGNYRINTASGNLVVNGTLTTLTYGILDLGSLYTLSGTLATINNGGNIRTAMLTVTSATPIASGKTWGGTVDYSSLTGSQTVVEGSYNQLILHNTSGTNVAGGNITITDRFRTAAGGTLDMGAAYRMIDMPGLIINDGTVKTSVLTSTSATPFPAGRTWGGTGTVEYASVTGAQTVMSGTYNNLKLSNISSTNTASGNITVGGVFTLSGGTLTTGANMISLNATASLTRIGGHVVGNFQKYVATGATSKTFEIGDANRYTPVTVSFASVTVAGSLTASTTPGDHWDIAASAVIANKTANRYWTLTNSGIAFTDYDAVFNFVSSDVDAGASTANFVAARYNSGWIYSITGPNTPTSTGVLDMTTFGDFQLGEAMVLSVKLTSIKAIQKNRDVQVIWEVAGEMNIEKYEVLKSADGISFSNAGTVTAKRYSSAGTYEWVDSNPVAGTNYYYVRAVETNGKGALSRTTTVKVNAATAMFNIFPNPVKNRTINIQAGFMQKGKYNLIINNPQGQQVFNRVIEHPGGLLNQGVSIDKVLPSGMYYLQIIHEQYKYIHSIIID